MSRRSIYLTVGIILVTGILLTLKQTGFLFSSLNNETLWYQMVWNGQNVGYLRKDINLADSYITVRNETVVNTMVQGEPYGFRELEVMHFEGTGAQLLLNSLYRYEAPLHFLETRIKNNRNELITSRRINHQESGHSFKSDDISFQDYDAVSQWIKGAPAVGETITASFPSIRGGTVNRVNYKIDNIENNLYLVSYLPEGQKHPRTIEVDSSGQIQAFRYNDVIELVRVTNPEQLEVMSSIDQYQSKIVKLDQPLGDAFEMTELKLKVPDEIQAYLATSNRQQPKDGILKLHTGVEVIRKSATDKPENLQYSDKIGIRLTTMADKVTKPYYSDYEKLTALREFVSNYLADEPRVSVTNIQAILDNPEGDCTEHTLLFNALAQSIGYSTRPVNGLVYLGDEIGGFAGHQWSEVFVDGHWMGFDASWNINTLTATHIRLNQEKASSFYHFLNTKGPLNVSLLEKIK